MTKTGILLVGFLITSASLLTIGCEETEPTTTGGGGSAGEGTSSSSSSSGTAGGGGAGGGAMMTMAEKYCTNIMANCTGANAQYPSKDSCMAAAATFAAGMDTDTKGNTLGCRVYHTTAAASDAATHCPHAGPAGGGTNFCGATCEGFCDIAAATCKTEWPDKTACLTACALVPTAVADYNTSFTSGNTIECRLYHLSVAAESATSATTHCPHTNAVMSDTCK